MVSLLIRIALVFQIFLFAGLAGKTTFISRMNAFDWSARHKLFFIVFVFLAVCSFYPRCLEILIASVKNNIRYTLFIIVIGLIGLEVMIKILYPNDYPTYSYLMKNKRYVVDDKESLFTRIMHKGDYFAFKNKNNLDSQIFDKKFSSGMSVQTNSEGFRFFDNIKFGKKIMVLGDSLTFGTGVDNGATYADQLDKLFKSEYTIHNYGTAGWSFAEYYLAYEKFFPRYDFPLIIIGVFPGNDFSELGNSNWKGKEDGMLPVPPLEREDITIDEDGREYGNSYLYNTPIIREIAILAFANKVVVAPFLRSLRAFKENYLNRYTTEEMSLKIISEISKNSNLVILLLPPEYHYPDNYSPEDYVKKLESIDGVSVLDFYPIFADKYQELYVDLTHFNVRGNYLIAQKVFEFIKIRGLL